MSTDRTPLSIRTGLLLVALTTGLLFCRAISFQFQLYWDDNLHILNNPLLQPVNGAHIAQIWTEPYGQLYIPVAYTVWAVQTLISGSFTGQPFHPAIFHATNVIIHVVASVLLFSLMLRLLSYVKPGSTSSGGIPVAATLAALFFACHPLQVESVAWISSLRDVMGGMFGLLSLWLYVMASQQTKKTAMIWLCTLATLSFLLALGSKPGMVTVPAVALLLGAFWMRLSPRFLALSLTPWFILGLAWAYITGQAQPSAELASHLVPVWLRPLIATDALAFYIQKLFLPFNLCTEYGRAPNIVWASGAVYWTWVLPLLVFIALVACRAARWALVPFGIFVAALSPMLGLIPFNYQYVSTVADRYAYFALLGPALALGALAIRIPRARLMMMALPILAGLVVLTWLRLGVWVNGQRLFADALQTNPGSWKAQQNYGCIVDDLGDHNTAIRHLNESLHIRPENAEAYNDLGAAYAVLGRNQEAIASLRRSLQIRPMSSTVRNLVVMLLRTGHPREAEEEARRAEQQFIAAGNMSEAQWIRDQVLRGLKSP